MAFECSAFTHNCTYGGYELIVFVTSFDILSLEIIIPMVTLVSPEILTHPAKFEWRFGALFYLLLILLANTLHRNFFIPQLQQRAQIIKYVSSIAPAPIHRKIVSVVFNALRER
jgi:hypothetical protein